MEYYPDTLKALEIFQSLGFDLFIVTNQSGVGRGYFSLENVHVIHRQLQNDLRQSKLRPFRDFAICPHAPHENCECRKPSPKMILEMIERYNLNPDECYMVGDKLIDGEAGRNAGIQGILVRHAHEKDFPFFKTLLEFAQSLKK